MKFWENLYLYKIESQNLERGHSMLRKYELKSTTSSMISIRPIPDMCKQHFKPWEKIFQKRISNFCFITGLFGSFSYWLILCHSWSKLKYASEIFSTIAYTVADTYMDQAISKFGLMSSPFISDKLKTPFFARERSFRYTFGALEEVFSPVLIL